MRPIELMCFIQIEKSIVTRTGLFDQYLFAKTKDPYMESVNLGADWLQCIDTIQKRIQQTQDYVLYRYAPYLPVAFHMYFAKASAPKIPYSNVAYDVRSLNSKALFIAET